MKGMGLLCKPQNFLPCSILLTIYKSFIRLHLDYGDVMYDQLSNTTFSSKTGSVQYNAALAITDAIRGLSWEKLYHESGLEYLHHRRWMRRLCLLYKVLSDNVPKYIYELLPPIRPSFRNPNWFSAFPCRTKYFKNSFLPCVVNDWNTLNSKICNFTSFLSFRNALINFIRPSENKIFNIYDELGITLLRRLRLGFSHLREHIFRHNFEDTLNPLCPCSIEPETTIHFFYDSISTMEFEQSLWVTCWKYTSPSLQKMMKNYYVFHHTVTVNSIIKLIRMF